MTIGTTEVTLRLIPAAEADHERLAALINAAFAVYPFLGVERTSPEGVAEELGDTGRMILAEAADELVGCAMIRPSLEVECEGTRSDVRGPDAMYLGLVSIKPGEMRQGLGRKIVAEAERIAARGGYRTMVLGTLVEMGNVDYYERLGYRVEGSEDFPPGHWGITIPHRFRGMVKTL